jgi:hypothetical protein
VSGKNEKLLFLYNKYNTEMKEKGSEIKNICKNEALELSKPKFDFGIY